MKLSITDAKLILRLSALSDQERNARQLTKATGMAYSYISIRLTRLCDLGVTNKVKRGNRVFYTPISPEIRAQAEEIMQV